MSETKLSLPEKVYKVMSIVLSCFSVLYAFVFVPSVHQLWKENPEFKHPKIEGLWLIGPVMLVHLVGRAILEPITAPLFYWLLAKKYKDPKQTDKFAQREMQQHKMFMCAYKLVYHLVNLVLFYPLIVESNYLPTVLGGKFDMSNWKPGYPGILLQERPAFIDMYYSLCLGYYILDYLLHFKEARSDTQYYTTMTHHILGISLIAAASYANLLTQGILLILISDFNDLFVYSTKILIHSRAPTFAKIGSAVALTAGMIYNSLFVFFKLTWNIFENYNSAAQGTLSVIIAYLCILLGMNFYWTLEILQGFRKYIVTRSDDVDIHELKKKED